MFLSGPAACEKKRRRPGSYPEINIKIPTATKFPVTNLKTDAHPIIFMQRFVEAFPRVCLELDVVCCHGGDPAQRGDEQGRWGEPHGGCRLFLLIPI